MNKLFYIVIVLIVCAMIVRIADGVCSVDLSNTTRELIKYQYAFSHGILPEGNEIKCIDLDTFAELDVSYSDRMYKINNVGCQIF